MIGHAIPQPRVMRPLRQPQAAIPLGNGRTVLRAKLELGPSGDVYEQEADRVAEQVMRAPVTVQRRCDGCQEELQRSGEASAELSPGLERRVNALHGGGEPLPAGEREFFESRFGQEFGNVRLHTGGEAAALSESLAARAFTVGQDVVMGAGEYLPGSDTGRRLLAHELTHVVQQGSAVRRAPPKKAPTPEELARQLREAFRGAGTDEDAVYAALGHDPALVREAINYYNEHLNDHTGQGLVMDLEDEMSGDELARAMKLLNAAMVGGSVQLKATAIGSGVAGEPDMVWAGLIVRGKWSAAHHPGVMEQHADVLIPDAAGNMRTRGYFGEQGGPGSSGSGSNEGASSGFGMKGVSADWAWFMANRPHYIDLDLAIKSNTRSALILVKVTRKQAADLVKYWDDLKKDPGTFNILGANCSTAAAAGFDKASVTGEIGGLDTPDNLYEQIREQYPDAYMISGFFGYTRAGRQWGMVDGRPALINPGAGPWMGPFVVQTVLK